MITCLRTNPENEDFKQLVTKLDADLKVRDGEDNLFYSQFNKINKIKYAIIAYNNNTAVGCGAIKENELGAMEIKRMYVIENRRGEGIASTILKALEKWAFDLNYYKCVLETGKRQPEAIEMYKKNGYNIIPNFGQYKNVENSICFEKILIGIDLV